MSEEKPKEHPGRWIFNPVMVTKLEELFETTLRKEHELGHEMLSQVRDHIRELEAKVKELEEYKWKYEGLCK